MNKLFWTFLFLIPFQARWYKFLKPLSRSWLGTDVQLPVYFEPHADLFISDLMLLLLVGWWIYRKGRLLWQEEQKCCLIFLGVTLLSIVLSDYSSYVIAYWRWGHLVIGACAICFLRSWMQTTWKSLITAIVLSGVLECAVALPQYCLQHQIGLKMIGEPTLISKHVNPPTFDMPKKALTSLDYYMKSAEVPTSIVRCSGTLPHPNVLGGFLVFSILMTCCLYEMSLRRHWVGAALILQMITLFTTYSRSALFACGGAILVWLLLSVVQEKRLPKVWSLLAVGMISSFLLFFPQIFYRGGVVSYNQQTEASDGMRIQMQNIASLVIQDHPWFGVGFNNYLLAFANYAKSSEVQPVAVHNIYLLIAVETGLIGLALFLIFCAFVLYRGWQVRSSLEGRTLLAIFLAFLAIGIVDYYPVVLQQARLMFFLTAGLITWCYLGGLKSTHDGLLVPFQGGASGIPKGPIG